MDVTVSVAQKNSHLKLVVDNKLGEVIYEITKKPNLLSQYFELREACYRRDMGLKEFSGASELYDQIGYIAVARINERVIGGGRLVVSTPDLHVKLPLEDDGFILSNVLPNLHLPKVGYCEIGRFAVEPDFRDSHVSTQIVATLIDKAKEHRCAYHFVVSTLMLFRNHRLYFHKLGYRHEICKNVRVPSKKIYERLNNLGMVLSITYLRESVLPAVEQEETADSEVERKLVA